LKARLDQLLLDRQLARSLAEAQAMIGAGEVCVEDRKADKPGKLYPSTVALRLKEKCPYVSRGGLKLAKGLSYFDIDARDKVCIDVGASTGGFTDCLLQQGAARVYAIDVAYGQLAWKIRQNPKVVVLERFNAKNISAKDIAGDSLNLAVMDVSFISLTNLLAPIASLFTSAVAILALIKPQFELPKRLVGDGGVVVDPALHRQAIDKIADFAEQIGLRIKGVTDSPILGPKGNREFLIFVASP
jgi:23S rRNA (cytidine1920-2'-O)/16S rRNA (cytidine1409-2'-O)-methyltransferase